jgi:hypothetical protein
MPINEFQKRLDLVVNLLQNMPKLIQNIGVAAGRILYGSFVQRIFQKGLAADGSPIGGYSTKPAYFSPKQTGAAGVPKPRIALPQTRVVKGKRQPSLTPIGKGGQTVFKNGKPHKTAYLATGYSGFRKAYGRQNGKVDLNLTGSLFLSIQLGITKKGVVLFFATQREADIGRGNEKRFAKSIFETSPTEKDLFDNEMKRILALLIREIMAGKTTK